MTGEDFEETLLSLVGKGLVTVHGGELAVTPLGERVIEEFDQSQRAAKEVATQKPA